MPKKQPIDHSIYNKAGSKLYSNSSEFLEQVTQHVNTSDSIYECIDSYLFPTNTVDDEYVVLVLKIKNTQLHDFYGGQYIIQQWTKKKKLFQTVHNCVPNHFFLTRQRFTYSLKGNVEECQWIYVVSFYQEIFSKMKHPLFDLNSADGSHEISLYTDAKQLMVISSTKIMWAMIKSENGPGSGGAFGTSRQITSSMGEQYDEGRSSSQAQQMAMASQQVQEQVTHTTKIQRAVIIVSQFKNVLANHTFEPRKKMQPGEEEPEFSYVQVFDINNEGLGRKDIHVICDCEDKIVVVQITPIKLRETQVFKIVEKIKFDKNSLDLKFNEKIKGIQIVAISDTENIYLMTKESEELRIITEKDQELATFSAVMKNAFTIDKLRQSIPGQTPGAQTEAQQENIEEEEEEEEEEDVGGGVASNEDASIKASKIYIRRTFIYIEEVNGQIKKLNMSDCKLNNPLKRAERELRPSNETMIQDIANHLAYFSDYIMANTALIVSHGKLLSIYNFKTKQWDHIIPEEPIPIEGLISEKFESYFGMPEEEIKSLTLNYIFPNSIYDCFVEYEGSYLRRLKHFNEINKTCLEKRTIFKDDDVKNIVKNFDMKIFKKYGDSQVRTFFHVDELANQYSSIWVCENGGKITKLIQNIHDRWQLLDITNAPNNILAIFIPEKKRLAIYNIQNVSQTLSVEDLNKPEYRLYEILNFVPQEEALTKHFLFKNKLYYTQEGNLVCWSLAKAGKGQNVKHEYNFKSTIKEFFMTFTDSIYYKDKKNVFRYCNLHIQTNFDIESLPTKVLPCYGSFVKKIDYCVITNRLVLFSSPFKLSIIPNLSRFSIDLMATKDYENNFIFWKQDQNILYGFKQPNLVLTWDLDTGKVLKQETVPNIYLTNFKKHSDWNGTTLLKQQKEEYTDQYEKQLSKLRGQDKLTEEDIQEEKKQRALHPNKHLFSLVEFGEDGQVNEKCRFLFDDKLGVNLFVSYPYLLVMDDDCTKQYILEGNTKFKVFKRMSTFYEQQMRIGRPIYFSPDLMHRIFIDQDTKKIVLNYTLTNQDLLSLPLKKKQIMYQKKNTHPMIYFHDNAKIMYVTTSGVEKILQIEKITSGWKKKTTTTIKEIANTYYSKTSFVRRFIIDQINMNKQLVSTLSPLNMLRLRYDITRRNILLNEYLTTRVEDKKIGMKREYIDKNVGDFNNLIVGNYRRNLSFSYLAWKIIEEIAEGNCSLNDLKKDFVQQLCFVVLPDQRTLLHHLNNNFEQLQNFIKILSANESLQGEAESQDGDEKRSKKEFIVFNDVAFIPDLNGQTPLHISVQKNNTRFTDKIVNCLATTEFDHHIRFILNKFHKLIDQVPQALQFYVVQRQKVPIWLESYTIGKMVAIEDCDFVTAQYEMWQSELDTQIKEKMFKGELDQPLTMRIIDLPNFQKYENKYAFKVLKTLSETDNIELFQESTLKAVVEIKWPLVSKAMSKYLFTPYLILLFGFLYYSVFIFESIQKAKAEAIASGLEDLEVGFDLGDPQFWIANQKQIIKLTILCIAIYFFSLEFRQFVVQGPAKYLSSPWNYIDIIPLTSITCSLILEYFVDFPQVERAINSVSSFFLWLKFLYFLRMNRPSSKFISMIVAIMAAMKVFLVVLFIAFISFSQSLYILSNNNPNPEDRFIHSMIGSLLFTYEIALGSWDVTGLGSTDQILVMTLFILSTLFLCVIMLNLLIAVISDVYALIDETSECEVYKNIAELIVENEYLIKGGDLEAHDRSGDYLYIASVDAQQAEDSSPEMKLKSLKRTIKKRTFAVDFACQDFAKNLNNAIHVSGEKFVTMYLEESMKGDLKFKQQLRQVEIYGDSTQKLTKNVSSHEVEEESKIQGQSPNRAPQNKKAFKPTQPKSNMFPVKELNDE